MIEIKTVTESADVTKSSSTKEGESYFYYDASKKGDAPYKYSELLNSAKKSITIWDPYLTKEDVHLFDDFKVSNIDVLILCICDIGQSKSSISDIADNIYTRLSKNNSTLTIKCYRNRKDGGNYFNVDSLWHDRYLIIDNFTIYLVGSSLSNQLSGKLSSGIYRIADTVKDKNYIISALKYYIDNVNKEFKGGPKNGFSLYRPKKH